MDEELIDYLFETSRKEGFKKNREDFVKYLQSDDELFDYLYGKAQKEGYKRDKAHFAGLVGRTTTAAPVATTEPAKTEVVATTTEPAKTEPAKVEPTITETVKTEPTATIATETAPTKTEVVAETKVAAEPMAKAEPQITVKEVEAPVKEEPKKELPVSTGLIPVTEKTEVKAVETPSEKMVIKSEKKEEAKKDEWECPPGEKGCSKNEDVVSKYIDKTYHKNKKDYAFIADREGNLASFIDDGGRGKSMAEVYKDENYNHDKKGFMYAAEELPKSKRFSTYSVPVNGVETSIVYDNKTGIILKDTGDIITNKQGNQVKTWLDVPTNNPEYEVLKAEIDKAKGGTTAPKVSTVPTLEPWQQPMEVKEVTEQPKIEVKEVTKEEPKMVIKSEKKGKMKVAPEPIKIEPIKVETKEGQIQVEVPTFAIPEPKKKYKPYGEKGPDVYYSEDYDEYIVKDDKGKTIVSKGSPKYEEIDKKIGETVKGTIEGTGKCDPDESGDSCSKNTLILSDFINNNFGDDGEIGWRASSEGHLIHKLNEDKKDFDKNQVSRYVEFSAMDLEDQNEKDPEVQAINKRNYEYNQKAGQIWYANDEPPKDKRFVIYKPYGDDRTLIYDKESEVILKQIGKAPEVDFSPANTIFDTKGNIVQKGSNRREFYKNYKKNNPDKGLNVWYGYHKDRPEYKELKSIIEGIDYKKAKGSKNTSIPTFNPVPETPEWQKQ